MTSRGTESEISTKTLIVDGAGDDVSADVVACEEDVDDPPPPQPASTRTADNAASSRLTPVMPRSVPLSAPDDRVIDMLSVKEKMTLDLERTTFRYQGSRDTWIRELFDEHAAAYYQRLNWLVDRPEAEEYAPDVVHRQKRLREKRRAWRTASMRLGATA